MSVMKIVAGALAGLAIAAGSQSALAQEYPVRPITLIVPFAAGGPTDVISRIVGEHMSRTLGQQIVIENVVGAGGTTASTKAKNAANDGYTLITGHMGTHAASVALYPNLAYHSTKGALVNFTRALAVEWAGRGVRVNAVAPTFVRTPLTARLLSDAAMKSAIEAMTPLGRLAEADEIADAVLYLASDAAAMVTGHTLPVDGGWVAR